jgi:hypothetical protein
LAALAQAWTVTTIAASLFVVAVAVAQVWDRAVFLQSLREAASRNPETAQPLDEPPDGGSVRGSFPRPDLGRLR